MQSRIASMVGFMADLITCYRSTHWGGLWGVQHLLMFYCFWPPVCPWVNQNCRVICSLSISWWDHNVSITFVVAGGPASTRSQLWAIFSPLYPTGKQNVLTMPQKWHMLQQPLRENTCPGKQYCLWVRDWQRCWEISACLTGCKWKQMFNWRSEKDRDSNFNRVDEPEFDPGSEHSARGRDWLQNDCKVIQYR